MNLQPHQNHTSSSYKSIKLVKGSLDCRKEVELKWTRLASTTSYPMCKNHATSPFAKHILYTRVPIGIHKVKSYQLSNQLSFWDLHIRPIGWQHVPGHAADRIRNSDQHVAVRWSLSLLLSTHPFCVRRGHVENWWEDVKRPPSPLDTPKSRRRLQSCHSRAIHPLPPQG